MRPRDSPKTLSSNWASNKTLTSFPMKTLYSISLPPTLCFYTVQYVKQPLCSFRPPPPPSYMYSCIQEFDNNSDLLLMTSCVTPYLLSTSFDMTKDLIHMRKYLTSDLSLSWPHDLFLTASNFIWHLTFFPKHPKLLSFLARRLSYFIQDDLFDLSLTPFESIHIWHMTYCNRWPMIFRSRSLAWPILCPVWPKARRTVWPPWTEGMKVTELNVTLPSGLVWRYSWLSSKHN